MEDAEDNQEIVLIQILSPVSGHSTEDLDYWAEITRQHTNI